MPYLSQETITKLMSLFNVFLSYCNLKTLGSLFTMYKPIKVSAFHYNIKIMPAQYENTDNTDRTERWYHKALVHFLFFVSELPNC